MSKCLTVVLLGVVSAAISFADQIAAADNPVSGPSSVVLLDATTFLLNSSFIVPGPINGIAAMNSDIYVSSGDTIDMYADDGSFLNSFSLPGETFGPLMAVQGGLFAGISDASSSGVVIFDPTLTTIFDAFPTAATINGMAFTGGTLLYTSGPDLHAFSPGSDIVIDSGGSTDVFGDLIIASNGFMVASNPTDSTGGALLFDAGSGFFPITTTPLPIGGLIQTSSDIVLSMGNQVGSLGGSVYTGSNTDQFGRLALDAPPVPEPSAIALAFIGLAGIGFRRLRSRR